MYKPVILPTDQDNLALRQLSIEDAPAHFEAVEANRDHLSQFGDETAIKYPDLASVEQSIIAPSNPDKVRMGIWVKDTFVGSINLTPEDDGSAEIGYWLDGRFTGNGYASSAAKALSEYAVTRFVGVYAEVVDGNEPSARVLERSGYVATAREAGKLVFELPKIELIASAEIDQQLDEAFRSPRIISLKNKPAISPKELAHREKHFSQFASNDENMPMKSYENTPLPYEVSTDDASEYLVLLTQAMRKLEIMKGAKDPGLEPTLQLMKTANHEIAHGRMAKAMGVGSRYGVRVLHDPSEGIWAIGPFHSVVGDGAGIIMLSRLQEAAIAVFPEDASEGDLISAKALGYSGREHVLQRLHEVYPALELDT